MITREVELRNRLGLHARAAGKLVNVAGRYSAECWISLEQRRVNAKSIMGLLTLAAPCGAKLVLELDGEDEHKACAAITELIDNRFDEPE